MPDDMIDDPDASQRSGPFAGRNHPPIHLITDALTFQLARLVAVHERSGGNWTMREFGVSLNEWRVLGLAQALGPVRTGRIAQELLMDKGQLSRVVRSLIKKGYLRARADLDDARASLLELTEVGLDTHDRLLAYASERNERVAETLTREECEALMSLVDRMIEHNSRIISANGGDT